MREIVNLFSERESRDELGIGQVRDALSDTLFPGTSTLLTRARYMILIPWCFVAAAEAGGTAAKIESRVDENERVLIAALKAGGDETGLLGRVAGRALKNLPSSLYWVALRQFGILSSPDLDAQDARALGVSRLKEDDEGDGSPLGAWSSTLPAVPDGFPANTGGGFQMNMSEAGWLRDRIREGAAGSLLAQLVENRPEVDSSAPWFDSAARLSTGEPAMALNHARLLSFGMHSAALLYNLMLAERYEAAGFDAIAAPVDRYRALLDDWQQEREPLGPALSQWDRRDLWRVVFSQNPRVASGSRLFVDNWLDMALNTSGDLSTEQRARDFIARREATHKRSQARLRNEKLLASWQGAAGAGALVFRWPQVRGVLTDLHDGLERTDA